MKYIYLSAFWVILGLNSCGNSKSEGLKTSDNDTSKKNVDTVTVKEEKRESPKMELVTEISGVEVKIMYGSPSVKGRKIWGDLVPYDKVWRTGANEATTIEFSKDVLFEGKKVAAGKYSLFTIPGKNEWTLILNSVWDQWGAFEYQEKMDVLRVKVKPLDSEMTESLTFKAEANKISLFWEKLQIPLNIQASSK